MYDMFMYGMCGWYMFGRLHICGVACGGVVCGLCSMCDVWCMYCVCCGICLYGMLGIVYMWDAHVFMYLFSVI